MTDLVFLVLVSPLALASLVFLAETAGGIVPSRRRSVAGELGPMEVAVLVPAHDEAAGIARVIAAIRADLPPGGRLLVVADNCTDDTAQVARAAGAQVTERHDEARRGKGFALDHGRAVLAAAGAPTCVIVVDADTAPRPGAIPVLAARVLTTGRPVQAAYSAEPGPEASSIARFSAAAFYVKNVVRELGAARLGVPAILTGSGMAFPWPVFVTLPLATGHVTEDLMIGIACAEAGHPPLFEGRASIIGGGASDRGTATQRRRWESGFWEVARHSALPLVGRGLARGRPRLAWLGLHLLTPPLVLLLAADTVAVVGLGVLALLGVGRWAALVMAVLLLGCCAAVGAALAAHRRLGLLRDWPALPRYLVWKLRLSVAVLLHRERNWIRTERD